MLPHEAIAHLHATTPTPYTARHATTDTRRVLTGYLLDVNVQAGLTQPYQGRRVNWFTCFECQVDHTTAPVRGDHPAKRPELAQTFCSVGCRDLYSEAEYENTYATSAS